MHEATFPHRDRGRFGAHSTEAGEIVARTGVRCPRDAGRPFVRAEERPYTRFRGAAMRTRWLWKGK